MGEALIIRSGGGTNGGGWIPKTELITVNQNFIVPKAKGQQFSVRIFGSGGSGGGNRVGGGGSGNMNYGVLTLNEGEIVPIIIGKNPSEYAIGNNRNGNTTTFGIYLSATGGEAGNNVTGNGGNGGAGGGGSYYGCGGHGTYGGGGGAAGNSTGGNGGIYGGGGGGGIGGKSLGGWGNGGNLINNSAENGLNTINLSTKLEFVGDGAAGVGRYPGGGGYGGRGGGNGTDPSAYATTGGAGGGGGFGGNGSDGIRNAGGGGGGYGNDASKCGFVGTNYYSSAGGGGGYGIDGYGHGGGYQFVPRPGVCIISYLAPVES